MNFSNDFKSCPPNHARSEINLLMQIMTLDDFQLVRGWCIEEGWNLGLHDASIYFETDPHGHFLFFDNQTAVGSMSLVKHSNDLFTIGPYIVVPSYRDKGYGSIIWEQVISRLNNHPNSTVLLYAVYAQVDRYRRYGFKAEYKIQRWTLGHEVKVSLDGLQTCAQLTEKSIKEISKYDQSIFTANRQIAFTEALKNINVTAFYFQKDNQIKGFGFIRPCIKGYRVGPLYADSPEIAKTLLAHLLKHAGNEDVIIDIPEPNNQGNQLMLSLGAVRHDHYDTIAMVKGTPQQDYLQNINKNYGIFSLEIG